MVAENTEMSERDMRLLKKSLALGDTHKNTNENEAMAAMLKAQEILAKYGKTLGDVNFEDDTQVNKEVMEDGVTDYHKVQKWEKDLAGVIARNFRCEYFWRTRSAGYRTGVSKIFFLGLKEDVEVALDVYRFALDVMPFLAKRYCIDHGISGAGLIKRSKLAYLSGFVNGLEAKFQQQVTTMAIVLVKDALVEQKVKEKNMKADSYGTRMTQITNTHALQTGYLHGKHFDTSSNRLKG